MSQVLKTGLYLLTTCIPLPYFLGTIIYLKMIQKNQEGHETKAWYIRKAFTPTILPLATLLILLFAGIMTGSGIQLLGVFFATFTYGTSLLISTILGGIAFAFLKDAK